MVPTPGLQECGFVLEPFIPQVVPVDWPEEQLDGVKRGPVRASGTAHSTKPQSVLLLCSDAPSVAAKGLDCVLCVGPFFSLPL